MNHEDAKRFACVPNLKTALGKKHMISADDPITLRDVVSINSHVYMMICAEKGSCGIFIGKCGDFVSYGAFLLDGVFSQLNRTIYINALRNAQKKKALDPVYREYLPLMNRQVKYYYSRKAPGEIPMWVVVVEGNEIGKFWTLRECDLWMKEQMLSILNPQTKPRKGAEEQAVEQEVEPEE